MPPRKHTVLIIEADPNALHVMRYHLGKAGFDVVSGASAEEALAQLDGGTADVIVSEFKMTDMDGLALRQKLYMDPTLRDIPFLFLIEGAHPIEEAPALRTHYDECLSKPFDPLQLVTQVQGILVRRYALDHFMRIDPVTRLLNRATADHEIIQDLERVARYHGAASLAMLDIEGFRGLNAEQGHAVGDLLLTSLASLLSANVRAMDLAGRYPGGRFILYLPETPGEGAVCLLRRIESAFAGVGERIAGRPVQFRAGVACAPRDGLDFGALYACAEQALVRARGSETPLVIWDQPAKA
jgi:two-component system, cell cycle response regulator